jgi:hypothetical protein
MRRRFQEGADESELDGNRLLPAYTGYIQFGLMMDSYPEAFLALNNQRRADAFELIRSSWYQLLCEAMQSIRDIDGLNSAAIASFRKIPVPPASAL